MLETLKEIRELLDLSTLLTQFVAYLPRLIAGVILFFMFYGIYRVLRFILVRTLKKSGVTVSVTELLTKVLKYFLFGLALLLMADQWGIKIIAIISTLGVVGLAVGLAAQQTLANLISGIIILVSKPFQEGDYVELDGTFGKINKISLRSTQILTMDNILVDLPNQKIIESKIVNHTYNKHIRLRIGVGIAYKEYIPAAQEVLLNLVKNDDRFLDHPAPEVVVTEIADSSINLALMVWIKDSSQEIPLSYDLRKKVKLALDEAGIQIPFPHRQLFVEAINTEGLEKVLGKKI